MRALKLAAALAVVLLPLTAPVLRAETLADALIAAYRNSNLLDQNRALLRAADEDVAVAISALRPVIAFTATSSYRSVEGGTGGIGAGTGDDFGTTLALTSDLTLIDFGRNRFAIEAAKETVLATREGLIDIEQNVLLAAVQAYVNVRLSQDIVNLRENNVRLITQELRAAQDRFEVGEITRTDVALAEARLAEARANLAAAQGDLLVARESYKAATGAYPGNLAGLPNPPAVPDTLDEARSIALRMNPLIRQAQRQVTVAELNFNRARANTRPSIGLSNSFQATDDDERTSTLSLSLNQTIYSGGRLSALNRQAIANRDALRAALAQTGVTTAQNVGNAWANLAVSRASIEANERQVTAQRTAFDGVREEARLGARTTLDVLDAEQDLLDAQSARLSAVATSYVSVYALLSTVGLLTVDHLKLGIPTYDPAAYYNAVSNAPVTSVQGEKLDRILKSIGN